MTPPCPVLVKKSAAGDRQISRRESMLTRLQTLAPGDLKLRQLSRREGHNGIFRAAALTRRGAL